MSVSDLRLHKQQAVEAPVAAPAAGFGFSRRARRTGEQPIGFLIATALANPHLISLAAGLVDFETLPTPECRELFAEIMTEDAVGRARLNYGTTLGLPALRHQLHDHLARLDGQSPAEFPATPEQIIVTTGSQQLLSLITEALVNEGDIVITGWPTYFVYTGVLATAGAAVRCVDLDDDGMVPVSLEETLARFERDGLLGRVKIVYVQSYHENPTGLTLSEARRPQLVEIVRRFSARAGHRILLMEDAAYRELTFKGAPPRSIWSFDADHEYVALLQTFSKPFAPGLKVGYGLLPKDLVAPVMNLKDNIDFGTPNLNQHLLLRAMTSGRYDHHVEMLRHRYHLKAAAMLEALATHFKSLGDVHWTHPRGGLYVWLTLPPQVDTGRQGPLFDRAVQEGVLYVPGEYCYGPDPLRTIPKNTLRLSFGTASIEHIHRGVERLAKAVRKFGF